IVCLATSSTAPDRYVGLVLVCIYSDRRVDLRWSHRVNCQRWSYHSGEVLQGRIPDSSPQELSQLDDLCNDSTDVDHRSSEKHSRNLDFRSHLWHMQRLLILADSRVGHRFCHFQLDLAILFAGGAVHLQLLAHPRSYQRSDEGV